MKVRSTASTIFILFLFGALSALAQSHPPKNEPSGPYTFEVNAEEVVLNCTVLDSKGLLVNGLDKSNFKVDEDGIQQTIISIQHQDTPVSIGLLVDNSGSMRPKRAAVTSAALDLVKASNPGDETFVINFSDQSLPRSGLHFRSRPPAERPRAPQPLRRHRPLRHYRHRR